MKTLLKCAVVLGGVAFLVLGLLIFLQLGGFKNALPGASHQIQELDFVGVVEQTETDDWELSESGRTTSGGPNSILLVGPGTLELDGGRLIEIEAQTPGGTSCPELPGPNSNSSPGSVCLVLGNFKDGTENAAWFSARRVTVREDAFFVGRIVEFSDGRPVFDTVNVSFVLDLSPDATFVKCGTATSLDELPEADAYLGFTTEGTEISIVECSNDFY